MSETFFVPSWLRAPFLGSFSSSSRTFFLNGCESLTLAVLVGGQKDQNSWFIDSEFSAARRCIKIDRFDYSFGS